MLRRTTRVIAAGLAVTAATALGIGVAATAAPAAPQSAATASATRLPATDLSISGTIYEAQGTGVAGQDADNVYAPIDTTLILAPGKNSDAGTAKFEFDHRVYAGTYDLGHVESGDLLLQTTFPNGPFGNSLVMEVDAGDVSQAQVGSVYSGSAEEFGNGMGPAVTQVNSYYYKFNAVWK